MKVALKSKINDKKTLEGYIKDYINNEIIVDVNDSIVNIPIEKVKKANLVFEMADFKEEV